MAIALAAGLDHRLFSGSQTERTDDHEAPPASQGGLVVQTGRDDDSQARSHAAPALLRGRAVRRRPAPQRRAPETQRRGDRGAGCRPRSQRRPCRNQRPEQPDHAAASWPDQRRRTGSDRARERGGFAAEQRRRLAPQAACWRYANGSWTPLTRRLHHDQPAPRLLFSRPMCATGRLRFTVDGAIAHAAPRAGPGGDISADNRNFRTLVPNRRFGLSHPPRRVERLYTGYKIERMKITHAVLLVSVCALTGLVQLRKAAGSPRRQGRLLAPRSAGGTASQVQQAGRQPARPRTLRRPDREDADQRSAPLERTTTKPSAPIRVSTSSTMTPACRNVPDAQRVTPIR